MRQQGRKKPNHQAKARRKTEERDGRAQHHQRKKQHQLPSETPLPISPSSKEQKLQLVNFLEYSSDDDEDKSTDYELLLSTFKPLAKKPRLTADLDERQKVKDTTIRRISSGGEGQDICASVQEGEGERVIEERGEEEGSAVIEEDNCSEGDGADGDDDDDAAGKG